MKGKLTSVLFFCLIIISVVIPVSTKSLGKPIKTCFVSESLSESDPFANYQIYFLEEIAPVLNLEFVDSKIKQNQISSLFHHRHCDMAIGAIRNEKGLRFKLTESSLPIVNQNFSIIEMKSSNSSQFINSTMGTLDMFINSSQSIISDKSIVGFNSTNDLLNALKKEIISSVILPQIANDYLSSMDDNLIETDVYSYDNPMVFTVKKKNRQLLNSLNYIINENQFGFLDFMNITQRY